MRIIQGFEYKTLLALLALTIGSSFVSSPARADLFSVPPLHLQPFEKLGLPSHLTKQEIRKSIQAFSDQSYGQAFVDIGDMSDYMHGHILWDPKIRDPKEMRALAILFHTQEFPNIRPDGYLFNGHKLDPYNRNWISWQEPSGKYSEGDLTQAQLLMPNYNGQTPTTVSADMLDPAIFGKDASERSTTFFFYRFNCDQLKKQKLTPKIIDASNLMQIQVDHQPVCLALVNELCNTSKDDTDCPGQLDLKPIDHRRKIAR